MKRSFVIILLSIILITVILVISGFAFQKNANEKQEGLTTVFDVSSSGTIAYVSYEKGKPGIYLKDDNQSYNNPILQLDIEKTILDIAFSPDGSSLAYIETNKDVQSRLESVVRIITLQTHSEVEIFAAQALITEIEFDPQDPDLLFYLRAGTFENYSPIASAHPHEFDLYSYQISNQIHQQHTDLLKYSMRSLNISPTGNFAFVQMDDDAHAETREDLFETKQRVIQIPLDSSDDISIVSNHNRDQDIYDFAIFPDQPAMIFQAVSRTNSKGIYEYELYLYNWDTDEENQLTYLHESASRPIIDPNASKIYFIVDKQFGKRNADYRLYVMDIDGKNAKEIALDVEENE
ncbi:PD40 domain-containing protein [Bacillus sp. FJAT-50079]|uniref:PD40 domain-containing protein n=1 Tax=Bacillus sp. FJAT-50079 TaxID=2833577 RepID=UPI001BCA0901|nr:PD40 domain-containing protein [Bacillus sp. FJAT-50079]MBS4209925.1 PD40 domain-containing protein [Bacillus sp. FJAT-50079]